MIIGLTGTIGAGKGTIVAHLKEKGFMHYSASEFLARVAHGRALEATREVRRDIGNEYRAMGPTALLEAVLLDANPSKEDLVIESLHTLAEVEYVRHMGGRIIAVDAPLEARYERIKKRASDTDRVTFEAFAAEQERQMASDNPDENNLARAIEAADFRLRNDGSVEELEQAVDAILKKLR